MTFTLGRQLSVGGAARSIRRKQHQLGRELRGEDEVEDLKD